MPLTGSNFHYREALTILKAFTSINLAEILPALAKVTSQWPALCSRCLCPDIPDPFLGLGSGGMAQLCVWKMELSQDQT